MTQVATEREPSLRGAPSYFRAGVEEAKRRAVIGNDQEGDPVRADYSYPGWHLAIHLEEYLTDEAQEELAELGKRKLGPRRQLMESREFLRVLEHFLEQEFPGCMALIPRARRAKFMEGIDAAIEEGRLDI